MAVIEVVVAGLAVELSVVLVEAAGGESLAAALALDADFMEGSPVHRHDRLGRVDRGLAGRAEGGLGGCCPTHPGELLSGLLSSGATYMTERGKPDVYCPQRGRILCTLHQTRSNCVMKHPAWGGRIVRM